MRAQGHALTSCRVLSKGRVVFCQEERSSICMRHFGFRLSVDNGFSHHVRMCHVVLRLQTHKHKQRTQCARTHNHRQNKAKHTHSRGTRSRHAVFFFVLIIGNSAGGGGVLVGRSARLHAPMQLCTSFVGYCQLLPYALVCRHGFACCAFFFCWPGRGMRLLSFLSDLGCFV